MKKNVLLILCICFCLSCKKEKIENKENVKNAEVEKTEVILDSIPKESFLQRKSSDDTMIMYLKSEYEVVYAFKDSVDEETSLQLLAIKNVEDNAILFHLYAETLPCDTEYTGKAFLTNKDSLNIASQNSLDDIIYSKDEKEYKLFIILNKNKGQARIDYIDKINEGTDCLPINKITMNLVK